MAGASQVLARSREPVEQHLSWAGGAVEHRTKGPVYAGTGFGACAARYGAASGHPEPDFEVEASGPSLGLSRPLQSLYEAACQQGAAG